MHVASDVHSTVRASAVRQPVLRSSPRPLSYVMAIGPPTSKPVSDLLRRTTLVFVRVQARSKGQKRSSEAARVAGADAYWPGGLSLSERARRVYLYCLCWGEPNHWQQPPTARRPPTANRQPPTGTSAPQPQSTVQATRFLVLRHQACHTTLNHRQRAQVSFGTGRSSALFFIDIAIAIAILPPLSFHRHRVLEPPLSEARPPRTECAAALLRIAASILPRKSYAIPLVRSPYAIPLIHTP